MAKNYVDTGNLTRLIAFITIWIPYFVEQINSRGVTISFPLVYTRRFGKKKWNDSQILFPFGIYSEIWYKKYGTLHEFACHPCAGAMLIFSVSFQF